MHLLVSVVPRVGLPLQVPVPSPSPGTPSVQRPALAVQTRLQLLPQHRCHLGKAASAAGVVEGRQLAPGAVLPTGGADQRVPGFGLTQGVEQKTSQAPHGGESELTALHELLMN